MVAAALPAHRPSLDIFAPAFGDLFRTYSIGDSTLIDGRGLAFGNTRLYAVTGHGSQVALWILLPRRVTDISIHSDKLVYRYGESATITAHLGYTSASRMVSIGAQSYGGAYHVVRRARVDTNGNLVAHLQVLKRTTFIASFAGDSLSDSATIASYPHPVRARVTNTLSGFFRQSGPWRLYHTDVDPRLLATIAPKAPGGCVTFRAEFLDDGYWRRYGKVAQQAEARLDANNGADPGTLGGTHYAGERVRLRAEWVAMTASAG